MNDNLLKIFKIFIITLMGSILLLTISFAIDPEGFLVALFMIPLMFLVDHGSDNSYLEGERARFSQEKGEQYTAWKNDYNTIDRRGYLLDPSNNKYGISDKNLKKYKDLLLSKEIDQKTFDSMVEVNKFERDYFINPSLEKEIISDSYSSITHKYLSSGSYCEDKAFMSELGERHELIPREQESEILENYRRIGVIHPKTRKSLIFISDFCEKHLNKEPNIVADTEKFKLDDIEWRKYLSKYENEKMREIDKFEKIFQIKRH